MKRPGFLKRGERVRLQTFLARSGISSRRAAEEMITHGRIAVNGETVTAMGVQVVPGVDRVEVDGEEVKVAPTTWLALHKPKGYVTTRTDPFGRETVYALLPEKYHGLFHVGRLDRDSEGLLLLTNDGDLANRFLHPSFGITKEYDVIVTGKPSDAVLRQLTEGVELEDGIAKAESAKLIGPAGNGQSRLKLVLREGKKREVRRMMAALGHEVMRLVRRRFGPIDLAELPSGKWRIVAPEELSHVRDPQRGERPARERTAADAHTAEAADSAPRSKAPARARHNAYGDEPARRHGKPAEKGAAETKRKPAEPRAAAGKDADYRTAAADRKAAGGKPARPGAKPRSDGKERKPARGGALSARPEENEWKPSRPAAKSARPRVEADAPPRKRTSAPARTHAPELDDWADAPRTRSAEDRPRARDDERRPAPRGKTGPRDRAAGGFDREERAAGPRGKTGPRDRAAGGFDREERAAGPRGKTGPRDRAAGGFDREERAAGPRGKAGPRNRAAGGFDREERAAGPRGKAGPRDRAAGGFDREERAAGPRGKTGPRDRAAGGFDREDRPARGAPDREGPAPRGRFDREERGGGAAGVRPPSPRDSAPADADEDELDSWGSAPRRSSAKRAAGGGARGGAAGRPSGARGGKPGGRPSGGRPSGGGRPGGKPGGGKPGGARGGGKPRKPGGGGKPRGR